MSLIPVGRVSLLEGNEPGVTRTSSQIREFQKRWVTLAPSICGGVHVLVGLNAHDPQKYANVDLNAWLTCAEMRNILERCTL